MTVSWATAPEYEYKGYVYMPHVEGSDELMGNTKFRSCFHDIYRQDDIKIAQARSCACIPVMTANHNPNAFMTEAEFQTYIDFHGDDQ